MPKRTKEKSKKMKNKHTCLVTGGAGFIGSTLTDRLVALGHKVIVVDDLSFGQGAFVPKKATFYKMDIGDKRLLGVFKKHKPDVVFHLAAQIDVRTSVDEPMHDAKINLLGGLNVLQCAVAAGVKRFVFSSSGGAMYHEPAVYPTPEDAPCEPLTPYGVAKRSFELYLESARHLHSISTIALRYANVFGPRQATKGEAGVIALFIRRALAGKDMTIFGNGKQTRDFVYVDDVVDANFRAMSSKVEGVFNVGTGRQTSVNEIARLICQATGANPPKHGPAKAGEELYSALDARKIRRVLGWKPQVKVEVGITRTVRWFAENA